MKKNLMLFAALLLTVFALSACSSKDKEESKGDNDGGFEPFKITFSHNQPLESPEHVGAQKFKEYIEKESDNKITVELYPASQLGSLREQIEGTQIGEIDITMQPSAFVTPFVDGIKVVDLPYLWPNDAEKMYEVLDSDVGEEVLGTLEEGGFEGLGFWPGGYKLWTTGKKEIHKPEDFKGLKVRVMESPLLIDQYKLWGANAIPVPYAEVYNSLQQGVVDGQENPLQSIYLNNYHEVQENVVQGYHGAMTYVLMSNKAWFDGLPKEAQELILAAEVAGKEAARENLEQTEDEFKQKIVDAGVNYYELTDKEIAAFKEVSIPFHEEAYNKPEQLELLKKLKDKIEEVESK